MSGSAYVFERDQGGAENWGQVAKLTAADGALGDLFGYSVSGSGTTVFTGADSDDDGGVESGSAYLFEIYSGIRGDCDANGQITDDDFIASISEIFDGDGSGWRDVLGGTYVGDPIGCDANSDTVVDAGDLTCKNRLIFGFACGGDNSWQAAASATSTPWLTLPSFLTVQDGIAVVEVLSSPVVS